MPGTAARVATAVLLAPVVLVPAACSGAAEEPGLTVLAAASLTGPFEQLAEEFEERHDVAVTLSFDSSATLAQQAVEGAPADVLATADEPTMDDAVTGGATAAAPTRFALNELVVAVPEGNPGEVRTLGDLGGSAWVRCVDTAPCGRLATEVLAEAGVAAEPVSLETDVRAVLTKVVTGEAEAGLVYATDAASAEEEVDSFRVGPARRHRTAYLVAPLAQADDPKWASAWIELLESEAGRRVLAREGFVLP